MVNVCLIYNKPTKTKDYGFLDLKLFIRGYLTMELLIRGDIDLELRFQGYMDRGQNMGSI